MASEEAVILRRAQADARITNAVAALTDRHGVEAAAMPSLPREVDPSFRAMIEREVMADTLEQLAASTMVADESPELIDALDAADERVRVALVALSEHAGLSDMAGVAYPTDASLTERREALADAVARNLESIVAVIAPAPAPDPEPDLTAMTRDELDAIAAGLGIVDADKLPNKAALIAVITDVRKG